LGATFDAVIVAAAPTASARVLGLTLAERGRRVAARLGARRVFTLTSTADSPALVAWNAERAGAPLGVLRAGDQVVHLPLLEPLLAAAGTRRVADDAEGDAAGALYKTFLYAVYQNIVVW
jgi:hypothetical protein